MRPCPFCGEDGRLHVISSGNNNWGECWRCNARGPEMQGTKQAIAAWNRVSAAVAKEKAK